MGMVPLAGIQRALAKWPAAPICAYRSCSVGEGSSLLWLPFARCGAAQPSVANYPCQTWPMRSDLRRTGGHNSPVEVNQ